MMSITQDFGLGDVNVSIFHKVLKQITQSPYQDTDVIFSTDTRQGFSEWIYNRFKYGKPLQPNDKEYYPQINWLRYMMKDVGYRLLEADGYESFNFIHKAVKDNYNDFDKIYIFTDDKVLYPLVDGKVSIVSPEVRESDIMLSNYEDVLKTPYNLYKLKLITVGDKSLDIKGITRFGDKTFEKFILKNNILDKPLDTPVEQLIAESTLKDNQKEEAMESLVWVSPRKDAPLLDTRPLKVHLTDYKGMLDYLGFKSMLDDIKL